MPRLRRRCAGFPAPSPWTDAFGDYCNGEPGRPLLVSLLLYLDAAWPRDWAAETLFLDDGTDCGVVVRPRRYRAVLMDQARGPCGRQQSFNWFMSIAWY